MRNVSNSEVTSFLSCRRMYRYAHILNLMPKKTKAPLYRGTMDHEAFQRYIEARLEGNAHDKAMRAGRSVFVDAVKSDPQRIDEILYNQMIWDRYMERHQGWPEWRLMSTEQRFELPLTDTLKMVIRYDVMVEDLKQGKILIGDWKFHYRFNSPMNHALNGQMPKYIRVMKANGIEVHGGFLEEVRTEKLGKEKSADPKQLWRRTFYFPSNAKMNNMLRQHIATALEIERFRALPEADQKAAAIPVLNKYGPCGYCDFAELCNTENDGGDIDLQVELDFTQNTYGYNFVESEQQKVIDSL